ncbi:MarR family winged helix-turn-helix transcriptional regulator [Paracoccus salsus]|uniref:MarR family winged helix-turn-helix transcriptional regulator n=1 Tax=Paracoccus salsus TaxID=2911061 RepID=UPI001F1E4AEF|nr:MarR family transcriptional regulator [Paracoccus salsus]MCF3972154.1 MarR family transcriptional regulator [Paracoccus salsus]
MTGPDPDRIDDALIALRRILRATEQYERDLAQSVGLTPAKLRVLQLLAARDRNGATPTALAQQMGVSQATVTALVDQLVKRGYAARHRSASDRRQTDVVVTQAGARAMNNAPNALQQQFVQGFGAMADWEQAMMIATLERVAALLNAGEIDASPVLAAGDIRIVRPRARTAGAP